MHYSVASEAVVYRLAAGGKRRSPGRLSDADNFNHGEPARRSGMQRARHRTRLP
jgi:hypothetical protein